MSDLHHTIARLEHLIGQASEQLAALKAQVAAADEVKPARARHLIKEGMRAFYEGERHCPYDDADDAECWSYGYALAEDHWAEVKAEA
ncbi:MAG: hypothetical protein ACYTF0_01650 [Planctomycetota bacterium]|jgi:hypothetical protein